jgi:transcriptional/translational regulatory protein YebC/TACO1
MVSLNRIALGSWYVLSSIDSAEEVQYEQALIETNNFSRALDIKDDREAIAGSKYEKLKKLVVQILFEAMSINREQAITMVDMYRKKWLTIMEHPNTSEFTDFDTYLYFRQGNGGMG